jgi:hypothetical protein
MAVIAECGVENRVAVSIECGFEPALIVPEPRELVVANCSLE